MQKFFLSLYWNAQETGSGGPTVTDLSRIKDVVARCNAMVSERPKASFGVKNLEQDLPRLLQSGSIEHHRDVLDRPQASAALAGLALYHQMNHFLLMWRSAAVRR